MATGKPALPLQLSERRLLLRIGDLTLLNLALAVVSATRLPNYDFPTIFSEHASGFVIVSMIWLLLAGVTDAYNLTKAARPERILWTILQLAPATALLYGLVPYAKPYLLRSRLTWLLFALTATASICLWRLAYATLVAQPIFRRRVLIVGAGRAGRAIFDALRSYLPVSYEIVGFVDDDPAKRELRIEHAAVLGKTTDLRALVGDQSIDEVVLAIHGSLGEDAQRHLLEARYAGVPIVPMAGLYEELTLRIPVEYCEDAWLETLLTLDDGSRRWVDLLQRARDLLGAGLLLLLCAPFFPLLALAITLDSPGPVFYHQQRLGLRGRLFRVHKFRSMIANAEPFGAQWARAADERVTRVGRLLRRARLDELPQLWNVLTGEMSLIGPRPERPELTCELERHLPIFRSRLIVKPGLTGWAQVNAGYSHSVEQALLKLQYDLYYIKHRGLYLDMIIALRTLAVMLKLRGT